MSLQDREGSGPSTDVPVVNEAMLASFYDAQIERLLTFLARRIGRDDAEDVASRIFEEFFAWWPGHAEHPQPVAVLYRVAQCRLVDHYRRSTVTSDAEGRIFKAVLTATASGSRDFEIIELRLDIQQGLAELPERQRQALYLKYLAELSVQECADVLGVGFDSMKKILKLALKALRESPCMDAYRTTAAAKEVHR
ncbi:sigma-70 family RNA polymerase sigma factor [Streptomyces sp. HP-A2021]|uniref:RNA polymerase sigma factor n=1 Tax=Streptomyces sp. HP-A2021 TaxID=2927875 RepID=UPI001FAFD4DE|nr:sigma-70 family RNA polymerase sigma factor [Streptomyces sp. HP-A2021]UOB07635.1 sigma-70 family RNA polymerase sigma factor [Streptomyces sp. HP-A2021]